MGTYRPPAIRTSVVRGVAPPSLLCALLLAATPLLACKSSLRPPSATAMQDSGGPIDFTRLRVEYGDRDDFAALCEHDHPLKQMVELTNAGQYREVLSISEPWLEHCPIDLDTRLLTAIALSELGQKEEADLHAYWYRGLVESILASGDGKSPDSPFVVISIREEYALLRAMNLRPKSQALIDGEIDALQVEGDKGEFSVFFSPAAHFRRLHKMFDAPE